MNFKFVDFEIINYKKTFKPPTAWELKFYAFIVKLVLKKSWVNGASFRVKTVKIKNAIDGAIFPLSWNARANLNLVFETPFLRSD